MNQRAQMTAARSHSVETTGEKKPARRPADRSDRRKKNRPAGRPIESTGEKKPARRPVFFDRSKQITSKQPEQQQPKQRQQQPKQPKQQPKQPKRQRQQRPEQQPG